MTRWTRSRRRRRAPSARSTSTGCGRACAGAGPAGCRRAVRRRAGRRRRARRVGRAAGRWRPRPAPAEVPVATATPTPSATSTPTRPRADDAAARLGGLREPCGAAYVLEEADDPRIEVQGGVIIGTLDRQTAAFAPDPAGSVPFLDVMVAPHVPGAGADLGGPDQLTTTCSWTRAGPWRSGPTDADDPAVPGRRRPARVDVLPVGRGRLPHRPAAGGMYRVFAHQAAGPETVELAPVTFGPDGTRPRTRSSTGCPCAASPCRTSSPTSPSPSTRGWLWTGQPGGLHAPVTVTSTTTGRLQGRVPQSMHAVLVRDGVVVSQAFDEMLARFDSGAPSTSPPGSPSPPRCSSGSCSASRRPPPAGPRRARTTSTSTTSSSPTTAPGPDATHGRRRTVPDHRAVAAVWVAASSVSSMAQTHHTLDYIEIAAPDLPAALDFYSRAFGWDVHALRARLRGHPRRRRRR